MSNYAGPERPYIIPAGAECFAPESGFGPLQVRLADGSALPITAFPQITPLGRIPSAVYQETE